MGAVGEGQRDLLRSRKSTRNYSRSIKSINKQRTNRGERSRDSSRESKTATVRRTLGGVWAVQSSAAGKDSSNRKSKVVYSSKHTQIKEQRQLHKDRNRSNDSNRRHISKSGGGRTLSMVCKIGNICGKVDTTNGQQAAARRSNSSTGNIDP